VQQRGAALTFRPAGQPASRPELYREECRAAPRPQIARRLGRHGLLRPPRRAPQTIPKGEKAMNAAADDTTLEITRMFDAPPARVFDAWLNREQWQSWIGPEGINCEVPLLEPRIGGRYRIIMRLSDGRVIPVAGIFKTIDGPRTLAFSCHEFHMHQIHFLLLEVNGVPVSADQQQFYDMYQVAYWSGTGPYPSIKVRMDFRGPDIGDFVYHCHILGHEDNGMMAIIRVLPHP
jgi:hypothetical protein